jgi:hypothetical protein
MADKAGATKKKASLMDSVEAQANWKSRCENEGYVAFAVSLDTLSSVTL